MNATDAARRNAVEARKIAYRQSKDGMVISFVLHPDEAPADLATAAIGTRYMLAAVRIGDDEQPESGQGIPPPADRAHHASEQAHTGAQSKRRWHEMPASQRAAILCGDEQFRGWLEVSSEEDAANLVRAKCGVFSRAHLDKDESARKKFDRLEEDFNIAVGRIAPPR